MTLLTRCQERARNSHHWRNSRAYRSHQSYNISMHLDAPRMCWITCYKVDKVLPNGNIAQDSGCTLVHHQPMPDQWHWCSTHTQGMYCHSSMSNSTTLSRWYRKSPPTWMPLNLNGNISVVSRSGGD